MKKLGRVLAILMAVAMLPFFALEVRANAPTQLFADVPPTHFGFNAVNWVAHPDNGSIMVGDLQGNFHPSQTITKFEAARIFAMAGGYRSAAHPVSPELRAEINRSFDEWRPVIDEIAATTPQWSRIADREIAFLLYRGVLSEEDLQGFAGQRMQRQEAVVWILRLVERSAHAQAIVLPFHTPFGDEANMNPDYIRYIYYARERGIIAGGSGNMFNPRNNVTRAQLAVIIYNTLAGANNIPLPGASTPMATVVGIVHSIFANRDLTISTPDGLIEYVIAPGANIEVDRIQRTAAFIRPGMTITAALNAQGDIISLVARTVANAEQPILPDPTPSPAPTPPPVTLHADEGFVVSIGQLPPTITIFTQRVTITGRIISEERTFTLAPNAVITRAGEAVPLSSAQPDDIAFFRFAGTVIHELELEDRERTIEGILLERRLTEDNQAIIIEVASGALYELRVIPTTEISRDAINNVRLQDLRIGDSVYVTLEAGVMTGLRAVGTRTITQGRLEEIHVTRQFSRITVQDDDGHEQVFTIMPGTFDVYSLRIGMDIRVFLDSWEVLEIQILALAGQHTTAVLGTIQAIRTGQTLTIVEMSGAHPATHTVVINNNTIDTATGQRLNFNRLRVNMNVYIVMVGPQSNAAATVTILP